MRHQTINMRWGQGVQTRTGMPSQVSRDGFQRGSEKATLRDLFMSSNVSALHFEDTHTALYFIGCNGEAQSRAFKALGAH